MISYCVNYIKKCTICNMKNKGLFIPQPTNQILCESPKELYVIDLIAIPIELLNNNTEPIYLLSIIDHFSKFANNYILPNKEHKTVISKINNFIVKNGIPDKILTDNGKLFFQ